LFVREADQHHISRLTLNQCRDIRAACTLEEIAFPVSTQRAVSNVGRTLADRDSV
jgi:hypothetical protein